MTTSTLCIRCRPVIAGVINGLDSKGQVLHCYGSNDIPAQKGTMGGFKCSCKCNKQKKKNK